MASSSSSPLRLANNAVSQLAANVGIHDTEIVLVPGGGSMFPIIANGQWFPITVSRVDAYREIMWCTNRTGDVLTVSRAQEATEAAAFSAGDIVDLRLTAGALSEEVGRISDKARDAHDAADKAQAAADKAQATADGAQETADAAQAVALRYAVKVEGTADEIKATFIPPVEELTDGLSVAIRAIAKNETATPTFAADEKSARTIMKGAYASLFAGDIAGEGHWIMLRYDKTRDVWMLDNASPISRTSNGYGTRLISTDAPAESDGADGDIWYRV